MPPDWPCPGGFVIQDRGYEDSSAYATSRTVLRLFKTPLMCIGEHQHHRYLAIRNLARINSLGGRRCDRRLGGTYPLWTIEKRLDGAIFHRR